MAEFEKARKLQEQLLHEHPGDRLVRSNLGWTLILEEWRGHTFAPLPATAGRQALAIFRSLVAEDPSDPITRDDLVWALWRLSPYVDNAEGLALADEAIEIGEQLIKEFPDSAEFRRELANALIQKAGRLLGDKATARSAAEALPFRLRALELNKATLADLKANRPEALLPARPEGDEANTVSESPMWAEFDLAIHSASVANLYRVESDWHHAAEMEDQSASFYKDLVEHNPAVATFTLQLANVLNHRIDTAEHENDREQVAAHSRDAVTFWNRQLDLHPEVPVLKECADDAVKAEREAAAWLAKSAGTRGDLAEGAATRP
jgi:tetratricopeptide (TPR) repeat protein